MSIINNSKGVARYLILLLAFFLQGCQLLPQVKSKQPVKVTLSKTEQEQQLTLNLLNQVNHYSQQIKTQRKVLCHTLKQDYKTSGDWQKAWLLVFVINRKFNCINVKTVLNYLNKIEKDQSISWLHQLNENQIQLIRQYQHQQQKNAYLRRQLKEKSSRLQQMAEKIKALTAIETQINHKLGNE